MVNPRWELSVLLFFSIATSTKEAWDERHGNQKHFRPHHNDHRHWGPFFEEAQTNVSGTPGFSSGGLYALAVPAGGHLHLDCRVAMLQDKMVMWVKKTAERVSLLTVGPTLYSADSRINLRFQYPNNWRLEISPVEEGDAGLYMCQLSTHPPRVRSTNLTVLSPEVMVVDEHGISVSERHYKEGSRIELHCQARISLLNYPTLNATVEKLKWRKDGEPTNLPIKTSMSSPESGHYVALSRLVVPSATPADSGSYSCQLQNQSKAVINVHVLQGETQAAVHHESSCSSAVHTSLLVIFILLHKIC